MSVKEIMQRAKDSIDQSFDEALEYEHFKIGEILELISCYKERSVLLELDEHVDEIVYDLFSSIYLSLSGLYKQSYINLRCALELGLSLLKFYDNRYSYLLWKKNAEDIQWSNLTDYDKGVLSSKYLSLFYNDGKYDLVIETASKCYRECSEYVHGKHNYINNLKDFKIKYSNEICARNLEMCNEIVSILVVLLNIRFENKVDSYYELSNECLKRFEV